MKRAPTDEYLNKAKSLSKDEAEKIFSRMRTKLRRRLDDKETTPLDAVAMQLQKEDEDLEEWRAQWAKIKKNDEQKKSKK